MILQLTSISLGALFSPPTQVANMEGDEVQLLDVHSTGPQLAEPSTSIEEDSVVEASTSTSMLEDADGTAAVTADLQGADNTDETQENGADSSSHKGKGKEKDFVPIHGGCD